MCILYTTSPQLVYFLQLVVVGRTFGGWMNEWMNEWVSIVMIFVSWFVVCSTWSFHLHMNQLCACVLIRVKCKGCWGSQLINFFPKWSFFFFFFFWVFWCFSSIPSAKIKNINILLPKWFWVLMLPNKHMKRGLKIRKLFLWLKIFQLQFWTRS